MNKIIIAVDGYSSCGKSTLAKSLAKKLKYIYIDTGAMYRCVALYTIENELTNEELVNQLPLINVEFKHNEAKGQSDAYLNGRNVEAEIRKMNVSNKVSDISTLVEVRKKLVEMQQGFGKDKGIVLDGRDIGTVVFPNAELKIFMTADTDIRAERRYKELMEKGEEISISEVKDNLEKRDLIDTTRKVSPLKKASDAKVLDNTNITPKEQLEIALNWAKNTIDKS